MVRQGKVSFSWNGLPQYAARLLRSGIEALDEDCVVVGSRPAVPIEGMEKALGQPIHWVDPNKPASWQALGIEVPRIFFQSGWRYRAFSALGAEVKRAGGHVIGMSDANWHGDFRRLVLGPVAFRLLHRRRFDAMLVPGRQGERLMRWFGVPPDRIHCGMYGADPRVFGGGRPLAERPPRFLFVGQFIARKGLLDMAKAFLDIADRHPQWHLSIIGGGEQARLIPRHERISVEEFVQPERLANHFRQARFLVLPSRSEAWGVVVHEAALSGCALVLSDRVGSAEDLGTSVNSLRFRAGDVADLARTLDAAAKFDAAQLAAAEAESRRLGQQFGPARFGAEVASLVERFTGGGMVARSATRPDSSNPPLFDVVGLGARDYYEVALALDQAGMLHKLRTDFYTPDRLRSRIRKRYNPALSSRKTSSNFLILVTSGLIHRLIRRQSLLHTFQQSIDYWFGFMAAAVNVCSGTRRAIVYSYYLVGFVDFYRLVRLRPRRLICFQVHPDAAPIRHILDADARAWESIAGPTPFMPDAEILLEDRHADRYCDALMRCDAVICASSFTKSTIATKANPSKVEVIPYGSRFDSFDLCRRPSSQRIKLVSVCQLTQRKGMHWAFRAMSQLEREVQSRFEWRVVASKRDPAIEALAPPNVVFLDRMPDAELAAAIADADLFVMPSLVEGFGLVYLEALSLGTPIVFTDNTGAGDFCQDGVHGFSVAVSDTESLRKVLEACADTPDVLTTMRGRCRELAQSLTWARFRSRIAVMNQGAD